MDSYSQTQLQCCPPHPVTSGKLSSYITFQYGQKKAKREKKGREREEGKGLGKGEEKHGGAGGMVGVKKRNKSMCMARLKHSPRNSVGVSRDYHKGKGKRCHSWEPKIS